MCCVQSLSIERALNRFEAPIDDPRNRKQWTSRGERENIVHIGENKKVVLICTAVPNRFHLCTPTLASFMVLTSCGCRTVSSSWSVATTSFVLLSLSRPTCTEPEIPISTNGPEAKSTEKYDTVYHLQQSPTSDARPRFYTTHKSPFLSGNSRGRRDACY